MPVSDASVHVHLHDRQQPLPRPVAESGERPWHGREYSSHARGLPVPDAHNICGKRVFPVADNLQSETARHPRQIHFCEHCDGMLHVHQQVQPPSQASQTSVPGNTCPAKWMR
ncbi:putative [Escherichia phage Mu]|uniref:Bacteriophage Mu left end n=1 Tax=Escherichia phage Mu TaxID=2681603 RepID=Q38472_BPMU|nr:putative [Escherichia phage Mu]